ncbi:hypothetical protein COCOBI_06-1780 [Coccomyxa sp. Obi]|nr:hypothetical protein COCOBI_06-1780 [Coccomyxa sp. Obi]
MPSGGLQKKLQVPACLVLLTWQLTVYAGAPLPGFEEEFLTVPSSIDSAADAPCLNIGYVVSDYDCTDVPSTNPEIKVNHCVSGGNTAAGVLIFQRQPLHPRRWPDVFRVRMTGHEIQLLPLHYCRSGIALAPYTVTLSGSYHFEVLHLYAGFSYDRHPHILDEASITLAQLTVDLGGTEFSSPPQKGCAWDGGCPECPDGRAVGRWIVRDTTGLDLETSCIVTPSMRTKDGNPVCGDSKLIALATTWQSSQGLAFQPYTCRMRAETEIDRAACGANRFICFVGDSQMRHAYNGVTSLFKGSLDWHGASGAQKTDKSIMEGTFTNYTLNNLGETSWNVTGCTDVIQNYGQWLAASELNRPVSVHDYVSQLRDTINHLQELQQAGMRVYWMTTNSFPLWRGAWYNAKRQEWRTDPVLLLYNQAANKMMEDAGIPVIDTYSISAPLNDVSYDAAHYRGHVGYHIDLRILNVLCPATSTAATGAAAI